MLLSAERCEIGMQTEPQIDPVVVEEETSIDKLLCQLFNMRDAAKPGSEEAQDACKKIEELIFGVDN